MLFIKAVNREACCVSGVRVTSPEVSGVGVAPEGLRRRPRCRGPERARWARRRAEGEGTEVNGGLGPSFRGPTPRVVSRRLGFGAGFGASCWGAVACRGVGVCTGLQGQDGQG